ncbi:uncharacterized protein VNE69_02208 [Vairimorpha necatrix]|uniref:Uncharacterized protein n=1 Tax=Vairimorpha necatrix TaxID=6039 RepID=A0AAX4J9W9_9MICR
MIFILNYIHCTELTLSEYIKDYINENETNYYISIIPSQEIFVFRPYDELQKNIRTEKTSSTFMKTDLSEEFSTCKWNRHILQKSIFKMEFHIIKCKNIIKKYIKRMKSKSVAKMITRMLITKKLEVMEPAKIIYHELEELKIDYLCIKTNYQLNEITKLIKKLNTPIEINIIIIEFIKITQLFLTIYDMEINTMGRKYSYSQRKKINLYNIEIYSLFNYIPLIETLENLKEQMDLYKYENIYKPMKIDKIMRAIKKIIFNLLSSTNKAVKIYEKLNRIYN